MSTNPLFKIGARHIVDASPLEELCTEAKLVVAVNQSGELCGLQKGQDGGIEPSLLLEMIQVRNRDVSVSVMLVAMILIASVVFHRLVWQDHGSDIDQTAGHEDQG